MSDSSRVHEIQWNPTPREVRLFGLIWFPLFYLVVGGVAWWKFDVPRVAWGIWTIGVTLSVIGAFSPALTRFLLIALSIVTYPLGWLVSHLLLGLIFYGVVTPIGFVLRLFGYDPLQRKFDRNAKTYWVPHKPVTDNRRYFRQY